MEIISAHYTDAAGTRVLVNGAYHVTLGAGTWHERALAEAVEAGLVIEQVPLEDIKARKEEEVRWNAQAQVDAIASVQDIHMYTARAIELVEDKRAGRPLTAPEQAEEDYIRAIFTDIKTVRDTERATLIALKAASTRGEVEAL